MALAINDNNFQELVKESSIPVVLDFWAPWCGPCRMVSPIIDELAEEFKDKALVAKCNVDDCADVPAQFRVMNIPTILFFKNGEVVDKVVGATTKAVLTEKINNIL